MLFSYSSDNVVGIIMLHKLSFRSTCVSKVSLWWAWSIGRNSYELDVCEIGVIYYNFICSSPAKVKSVHVVSFLPLHELITRVCESLLSDSHFKTFLRLLSRVK